MKYYKVSFHFKLNGEVKETFVIVSSERSLVGDDAKQWFAENIEHDENYGATRTTINRTTQSDFECTPSVMRVEL
jgi:hypothetical protein